MNAKIKLTLALLLSLWLSPSAAYAGQYDGSNIQIPQQQPSAALEVPQASQASRWIPIEPPMKPNPEGAGAWSVDLLAPQEKWSRLDHVFATEQQCEQYQSAELVNRATGAEAASFGTGESSLNAAQQLKADGYKMAAVEAFRQQANANLADSMKRILLITSIQNARCIPEEKR